MILGSQYIMVTTKSVHQSHNKPMRYS